MADKNYIVVEYDDQKFKDSVNKVLKEQQKAQKGFKLSLGKIALAFGAIFTAYKAVSAGIRLFINQTKLAVNASSIQEDSVNKLNASLAQTGQLSVATSQDLQAFSAQMEATTRFGDEAINTQLSYAISLGATAEQAKALTLASANLASAMGKDLQSASLQVNKTLGGYAGELAEVLPAIKNLTQEQLKNAEVATLINQLYGGRAVQDVKTYSGAIAQNANSLGTLREKFGDIITQNPVVIKIINLTSKLFLKMADIIEKNLPESMNIFNSILVGSIKFIKTFGLGAVSTFINVKRVVENLTESFGSGFRNALSGVQTFYKGVQLFTTQVTSLIKVKSAEWANDLASTFSDAYNKLFPDFGEKADFSPFNLEKIKSDADEANKIAEDNYLNELNRQNLLKQGYEEARLKREEERNLEREGTNQLYSDLNEALDGYVKNVEEAQKTETGIVNKEKNDQKKEYLSFWSALTGGEKKVAKDQTERNKQRAEDFKSTLNYISTLQRSKNKELAVIGKAAAISTATIDGIIAVNKALSSAPPPFNFALAGLVGAATAANVAQIAATPIGFATGGVIGGPSTTGDNLLIAANAKERVLTADQNRNFEALAFNNNTLIPDLLTDLIDVTAQKQVINNILNGKALNDELNRIKEREL